MDNLAIIKIVARGQKHVIAGPTRNDAIQKAVELLGLEIEMLDAQQALRAVADGATLTFVKNQPAGEGATAEGRPAAASHAEPTHTPGSTTPDIGAAVNKLDD